MQAVHSGWQWKLHRLSRQPETSNGFTGAFGRPCELQLWLVMILLQCTAC